MIFFSRSHHLNKWLANKFQLLRWKIVFKRCIQGSHCECYERISKNDTDSLVSVYSSGNGRAGAVDSRRIYRDQKNRPPDQENCIFCKSVILEYINNQNWKFLQKICTYYKIQNLYYIQCSNQLGFFFLKCVILNQVQMYFMLQPARFFLIFGFFFFILGEGGQVRSISRDVIDRVLNLGIIHGHWLRSVIELACSLLFLRVPYTFWRWREISWAGFGIGTSGSESSSPSSTDPRLWREPTI